MKQISLESARVDSIEEMRSSEGIDSGILPCGVGALRGIVGSIF